MASTDPAWKESCRGLVTDLETIRYRVSRGDFVFAQRVVLTALAKCGDEIRGQVLENLNVQHFTLVPFDQIFEWMSESVRNRGVVIEEDLYRLMEEDVRRHWLSRDDPAYDASVLSFEEVLPGYLCPVYHVLTIETPDAGTVLNAIAVLQAAYERRIRARSASRE